MPRRRLRRHHCCACSETNTRLTLFPSRDNGAAYHRRAAGPAELKPGLGTRAWRALRAPNSVRVPIVGCRHVAWAAGFRCRSRRYRHHSAHTATLSITMTTSTIPWRREYPETILTKCVARNAQNGELCEHYIDTLRGWRRIRCAAFVCLYIRTSPLRLLLH